MSREWKRGDLAAVLCSDGKYRLAFYAFEAEASSRAHWQFSDGLCRAVEISDAHALVVIDPEDDKEVERFRRVLGKYVDVQDAESVLRSLVTPSKPAEPIGLGAVVEDGEGLRYVYAPDGTHDTEPWTSADQRGGGFFRWSDVPAVKVLSEGVTA